MLSEIGSLFWIKPEEVNLVSALTTPAHFGCEGSDYVWMSTGRSATAFVIDTIEDRNPQVRKVAVIPPFTCHTVIEPFLAKGYEVKTFHTNCNLMATANDILMSAKECNAGIVLYHRFFGVDTIKDLNAILPELKQMGVVVIEDCTQNLYSTYKKSDADYFVGSIRKWCGVPDGGFAVCKDGQFENKPTTMDAELQEAKKEASLQKYEYLFKGKGEKQVFLSRDREAEDLLDNQSKYFAISDLSAAIQTHLNVEELCEKRRKNFRVIAEGLKEIKGIKVIFDQLADDEVPLYCPILCENRSLVQPLLVKNAVFAPVVWPKADCCPEVDADADYLYDHILCIPIDQRYDMDDMERIVNILKNNL